MGFSKKGMWKKAAAVAVAAGLALSASACTSDSGSGGSSATGSVEGDGRLLKVFMPSTSNVYLAAAAKAAESEAKELGYEISIVENNWDPVEQDQQVQEWLATGEEAAAILFWPTSAANATASIRALAEVAPILQWDQPIDPSAEEFVEIGYAGVNSTNMGTQSGEDMLAEIERLKGEGYTFKGGDKPNVIEIQLGKGDYASGVERHEAFMKVVDGKVNFLGVEGAADFDAQGGYTAASTIIPKYLSEGIDMIFVQTNDMGNGVVQAAEQNGLKPGEDVFLITGTSSGSMANLKSGKITTAVLQSPTIQGEMIVDIAAQYLATGKTTGDSVTLESLEKKPAVEAVAPARITSMMSPTVTAENIGSFKIWGYDFFQLMGDAATD